MSEEKEERRIEDVSDVAPTDLSEAEYDALVDVLRHNVEQLALEDPLLNVTADVEVDLVRLAYNDPVRLDRLERAIKDTMRRANYSTELVKKFNLGSYRRGAKHLQKKVADSLARRQALARRNLKVIDGGRDGREQLAHIPAGAEAEVEAWGFSQSPILQACAWLRHHRRGRIWYDQFHNNYFADWDGGVGDRLVEVRPVDDAWLRRCWTTIVSEDTRLAKVGQSIIQAAVNRVADDDVRSEPRDWLLGLQWDGVERLEGWLTTSFGVEASKYYSDVGRCWMVSLAARIMRPGCKVDTMPVLVGPQGTSKSSALEALGGKWYVAVNVSLDRPQDFLATLAGKLVAEIPELDAINGARVSKQRVKALLSTAADVYRPPYGKVASEFKRTAVFAGTTNDVGWHGDETGARRFWPIECWGDINLGWIRENRDQLFAEAAARLARGESWWDFDRAEQERRMEAHFIESPIVEMLRAILRTRKDLYTGEHCGVELRLPDPDGHDERSHWGNLITIPWVATCVLGVPAGQQTGKMAKDVAHALKKLGLVNERIRVASGRQGRRVRAWVGPSGRWIDDQQDQQEMEV